MSSSCTASSAATRTARRSLRPPPTERAASSRSAFPAEPGGHGSGRRPSTPTSPRAPWSTAPSSTAPTGSSAAAESAGLTAAWEHDGALWRLVGFERPTRPPPPGLPWLHGRRGAHEARRAQAARRLPDPRAGDPRQAARVPRLRRDRAEAAAGARCDDARSTRPRTPTCTAASTRSPSARPRRTRARARRSRSSSTRPRRAR